MGLQRVRHNLAAKQQKGLCTQSVACCLAQLSFQAVLSVTTNTQPPARLFDVTKPSLQTLLVCFYQKFLLLQLPWEPQLHPPGEKKKCKR